MAKNAEDKSHYTICSYTLDLRWLTAKTVRNTYITLSSLIPGAGGTSRAHAAGGAPAGVRNETFLENISSFL